jgi:hypothetical protein
LKRKISDPDKKKSVVHIPEVIVPPIPVILCHPFR